MPNIKINNKTHTGINTVRIPSATGSGNEDFVYVSSEAKSITENGTHDVKHYATVRVAVPTDEPNIQSLHISANGTYTATNGVDGYSPITVSVPSGGNITLQEKSATPTETPQTVTPDTGYGGLSSVSVGAISNTYVGSNVPKKSSQTYIPGTSDQTIASGQYLNGKQTIKGDANLIAANIKKGVSIFNVTGVLESGGSSGGSSGSLPTGISSLASGVYTPTQDYSSGVEIAHGLGVTPNFLIWILEEDVSKNPVASLCTQGAMIAKDAKYNSGSETIYTVAYMLSGYNETPQYGGATNRVSNSSYLTSTTCRLHSSSTYKLLAGHTYRWVCGVLDGIS